MTGVNSLAPHLRVARPSRDLKTAARFYTEGLGLVVLASFDDHDGFDGVILGNDTWPYHLEFTRRHGDPVAIKPTDEDLLVFYIPHLPSWKATVDRLRALGAPEATNTNPYWRAHGVTFEDADGYRVVIQNERWP